LVEVGAMGHRRGARGPRAARGELQTHPWSGGAKVGRGHVLRAVPDAGRRPCTCGQVPPVGPMDERWIAGLRRAANRGVFATGNRRGTDHGRNRAFLPGLLVDYLVPRRAGCRVPGTTPGCASMGVLPR